MRGGGSVEPGAHHTQRGTHSSPGRARVLSYAALSWATSQCRRRGPPRLPQSTQGVPTPKRRWFHTPVPVGVKGPKTRGVTNWRQRPKPCKSELPRTGASANTVRTVRRQAPFPSSDHQDRRQTQFDAHVVPHKAIERAQGLTTYIRVPNPSIRRKPFRFLVGPPRGETTGDGVRTDSVTARLRTTTRPTATSHGGPPGCLGGRWARLNQAAPTLPARADTHENAQRLLGSPLPAAHVTALRRLAAATPDQGLQTALPRQALATPSGRTDPSPTAARAVAAEQRPHPTQPRTRGGHPT